MELLRNAPGFFGPSLLVDVTLVVQILFYLVLSTGVVAQLQGKYKLHDWLQSPVVILNLAFIIFVMVPTFRSISAELPAKIVELPTLVATGHVALGAIAELLSIYCLLAGLKILPRKIGRLRYWMWTAYTAWTTAIVFGLSTYILFYAYSSGAVPAPTPAPTAPAQNQPVEEHAEEPLVEPTAALSPAPSATNTRVIQPSPTLPAPATEVPPQPTGTEAPPPESTATPVPPTATPTELLPVPTELPLPTATIELIEPELPGDVISEHDGG